MKRYLTAYFTISLLAPAFSQYNPHFDSIGAFNTPQTMWSYRLNSTYSHVTENLWSGNLLTVNNEQVNRTTADGDMFFMRGKDSGWGSDDVSVLNIDHDMNGWISEINNNQNNAFYQAMQTEVYSKGTLTSSVRAICLGDNNGNSRLGGSWTFVGGEYYGGNNNEVLYSRNDSGIVLDSVSFIGGEQTAGGDAKSAVFLASSASVTIQNSLTNDVIYQAPELTYAGTYTTVSRVTVTPSIGDAHVVPMVIANGGAGLTVLGTTANITGGGTFIGSQTEGGSATRTAQNVEDGNIYAYATARGGDGAYLSGAASITDGTYQFIAGNAGNALTGGIDSYAYATGGNGLFVAGSATISDATMYGGRAGEAQVISVEVINSDATDLIESAENGTALAGGGNGLRASSTVTLTDVYAYGAAGGFATANDIGSYADASGGNGFLGTGGTITGGHFEGSRGGAARSNNGEAYAFGGSGVLSTGDLTVNGNATFVGATGGTVNGNKVADGAGIKMLGGILTINGGTFIGSGKETLVADNAALWIEDATLNITSDSDVSVDGNIIFYGNSTATINAGMITGDMRKLGNGTLALGVSTNAYFSGSFQQEAGTTTVTLSNIDEGKFFSDIDITDGDLTFTGTALTTAEGATIAMGGSSNTLSVAGATFSKGTSLELGYNLLNSTSDLTLEENSSITIMFNPINGQTGTVKVAGTFFAEAGSLYQANGYADTATGSIKILDATSTDFGNNDVHDIVDVDFGWLTAWDTNQTVTTTGIEVSWKQNSLTNSSLEDLGDETLLYVDNIVSGLTDSEFYSLNSGGEKNGDMLLRFSLSQLPDVSEVSFQISQQLNEQIAARGTEFRSMNGFASSQPRSGTSPTGVAGPENKLDEEKTMQGWIRAYGGSGSKDATGKFAEYDTTSWGTVIGLDKSFGNLLVGIAGGYARTDLDAGAAYDAAVDTYHGSVYSTFGGDALFVDVALTYGWSSTDEENTASEGSFNSSLYSAYVGAGYAFNLGEKFSITPEISLLASYYNQEDYERSGILGSGTVKEYDTSSFLGSIGVNLATQHQLDWLSRGIAFIPEVRMHYLHEFDADPDDFSYAIGGTTSPFSVRSRDEHLFRFGLGVDMWSWKHVNTKFEIDYDLLTSDTYVEQIVSGKATWRF